MNLKVYTFRDRLVQNKYLKLPYLVQHENGNPLRTIGSSSFRWNKRKATFASLAEGKVWLMNGPLNSLFLRLH